MSQNKNFQVNLKALSSLMMTVLFLFPFNGSANEPAQKTKEQLILCKNKESVRTLRVNFDDPNKCMAFYNKNGKDQMIGSGMNPDSCVEFASNVRTNLEGANWNCRDIKESRTSMIKAEGME